MNDNHDSKKIFQEAMKDVTPLKNKDKYHHQPKKKNKKIKPNRVNSVACHAFNSLDIDGISPIAAHQCFYENKANIAASLFDNLCQGHLPMPARIDLHQKTANEAKSALERFMENAQKKSYHSGLIIHGKGTGLLKGLTYEFLMRHPAIKAFASAKAKDGGSGAIYCLF